MWERVERGPSWLFYIQCGVRRRSKSDDNFYGDDRLCDSFFCFVFAMSSGEFHFGIESKLDFSAFVPMAENRLAFKEFKHPKKSRGRVRE